MEATGLKRFCFWGEDGDPEEIQWVSVPDGRTWADHLPPAAPAIDEAPGSLSVTPNLAASPTRRHGQQGPARGRQCWTELPERGSRVRPGSVPSPEALAAVSVEGDGC